MITPPPRDTLDAFIDLLVDDIVQQLLAEMRPARNEEQEEDE